MDFDTFKKQLDKARELKCKAEGIDFTLTIPTEFDLVSANAENIDANGRTNNAKAMRAVLVQAIVGWKGATTQHIIPGAESEPLDFMPGTVGALLDARQDIVAALISEVITARQARFQRQEQAEKN